MSMSKRLLLFDFDETYFKHNTNEEDLSHLREMEKLLEKLTNNNEVITAVLTGSTFQSVMDKMDQVNMTFKPLHIFSDLSSKMFTWNNGEYVESETYKKKVLSEPFLFEDIVKKLSWPVGLIVAAITISSLGELKWTISATVYWTNCR